MRRLGRTFLAWLVGMCTGLAACAAEPPASALFTGRFQDFERSSDKVVGVYVPNWQPVALVDGLPGGSVTHLLYAFVRICGPGQQDKDAATDKAKDLTQKAKDKTAAAIPAK